MNKSRDEYLMSDSILFYPIQYSNYMNYIYSLVGEANTPKVYVLTLLTLEKFGPMPISRIGEWIGIAKPNMTTVIDGLTEKGWIRRSSSASDRRIINIEMTEAGNKYLKDLIERLYPIMQEQFAKLSDEDVEKMVSSLENLVSIGKKLIKA
jgi:MarR family transcriptional regulator, organic hydroperoxide resistance regulator